MERIGDGRDAGEIPVLKTGSVPGAVSSPAHPRHGAISIRRLAVFVLFNVLVVNLAIWSCDLLLARRLPNLQAGQGLLATIHVLVGAQGTDSLGVMLPVVDDFIDNPKVPIYESTFFEQQNKFQYPLTSLLPVYALVRLGVSDDAISQSFKWIGYLAAALTLLLCYRLALRLLLLRQRVSRAEAALLAATFAFGGLFYYPLMSSLSLGQIQTLLTLGFTVALLCWISGREIAASMVMGLMTAVKPQYGLFFVWALLRRRVGAAAAGLSCLAAVGLASLAVFGLHNNAEYFSVLRFIAARGEGYYENQSMNGLLNRLLFNGNNLHWDANAFAPANNFVNLGTTLTSLSLLGLAIFYPWGKERRGGTSDFAAMMTAATMASPIAWVHHYTILLPVVVWLWFGDLSLRRSRWACTACAVAYVLMSNTFTSASFLAPAPFWNLFQSYFYLGALLVFVLLLRSRSGTGENTLSPGSPGIAP
jgi:hypothetical protein